MAAVSRLPASAISSPMAAERLADSVRTPSKTSCSTEMPVRKFETGIRMVQRVDGEIGLGEAALGQDRSEHEHGLVPALPRLGEIETRKPPGPCLPGALRGLAPGGFRPACGRVLFQRPGDGVVEGQWRLCGGLGRGEPGSSERGQSVSEVRGNPHTCV